MSTTEVERIETRLRARFAEYAWTPIQHGMSGASTYRLTDANRPTLYVKIAAASSHPDVRSNLATEAERISWLASTGLPVPELVDAGIEVGPDPEHGRAADGGAMEWLVMTGLPGREASAAWPRHQRMAVMDALADALRALHGVPVATCPFDRRLDVILGNAHTAIGAGIVDDLALSAEPWKAEQERALLAELAATRPAREEAVVCHGDYCLPNMLLDPETLEITGLIDLGRVGIADRYNDLGIATRSISSPTLNPQYGEEHAARFLARYGADPEDPRIGYYRRLDELFWERVRTDR
ncbi:APH(3') family aminoglycoside O-phosphotransferase [Actinopolymorpha alba]|uniref:APH(3') family aminoglycoside O-phosphotransferase n=1 Tax=Actinopolymorpha alba TaxID=533267 RepID=UPI0012F6687F|nr:APH(3') family aminoglycoside O-phosphotransferase [Actinopolymorpha alba]